jgi:hypothetical protein
MSGNEELLKSFQMLASGIKDMAIGNSIKRAQGKVDEIRADQNMNEFERIKAQQALANAMGNEVLGLGGDAARAQQARLSLAPEIPDAAMRQLEATGASTLAQAQQSLLDKAKKDELEKFKREADLKITLQKLENAGKLATKGATAQKPVPNQVTDKLSNLMDMKAQLEDMKANFAAKGSQIGPMDQYRPNILTPAEDVAYTSQVKDFFNQYRRVITGAAASIPELKSLLPAVPNESDMDNDFLAKVDTQISGIDRAVKNRMKLLKAQGRDVSALEDALGVSSEEAQAPRGAVSQPAANQPPAQGGFTIQWKKK